MDTSASPVSDRSRRFSEWAVRHGRWLWIIALVVAIPSTIRTANLYIHLRSELEELLPRSSPSVLALNELRARMPGLQYLGVVVDTGNADNVPAAEQFIDDLAARIRTYPSHLVTSVRTGDAQERRFVEDHAPLYMETDDLQTIESRITARRDYEVAKASESLLDEQEPPSIDFSDIEQKYKQHTKDIDRSSGDRYSSRPLCLSMLLVEVGGMSTGSEKAKDLLGRVQADVRELGGTAHYAPGMRIGYSGEIAVSVEEMSALVSDLSVSSLLVVVAVMAVIVGYYRWWRSVIILMPPLFLATVYAFALASLPPFGVTALNSNTAFLGSIIIGNGINFGILLLARYVEERRKGRAVPEALAIGVSSARVGTFVAALAASASYASLIVTQFRGFHQFGISGGLGMIFSWLVAFLLMPSLIAWVDSSEATRPRPKPERRVFMTYVGAWVERYCFPIAGVAFAVTVVAIMNVRRFDASEIESDFSKLRSKNTWTSGDGYWSQKTNSLLGRYLTPAVLLTDRHDQAKALETRLREATKQPPLDAIVANVRTIDDVVPLDQARKVELIDSIREALTPKIRASLDKAKQSQIDRFLGGENLVPFTLADVPPVLTTALRERDGTAGRTVLVYPYPTHVLWDGNALHAFVTELRDLSMGRPEDRPARVAGGLPISADILSSVKHDAPRATAAAFIGVTAVVAILFRMRRTTYQILGSLLLGVLWLAGAMMACHIKINFANFIAFPITFGIGVDYSVNVMSRYEQDGKRDIIGAIRSTGGAVSLCSLTTIIGYSSLLLAQNRALYLFGLVAVLGEVACLATAILVVPSLFLCLRKIRTRTAPNTENMPTDGHPDPR